MILPPDYIKNIIQELEDKKHLFPKGTAIEESSEDTNPNIQPPCIGVYADFDLSTEILPGGVPRSLPVSIYAICTSSQFETASESFSEAFIMALNVIKIIQGDYNIENTAGVEEFSTLLCQEMPIVILKKSSSGSSIQVQFIYYINDLMADTDE